MPKVAMTVPISSSFWLLLQTRGVDSSFQASNRCNRKKCKKKVGCAKQVSINRLIKSGEPNLAY